MTLILFDVDGTLVDSQNIIVAAQRAAFAKFGLEPPSRERSLSIVGLSLFEAFTDLTGPKGPVAGLVEAYKEAFAVLRLDPAHEEPLFPGAADCLHGLVARTEVTLGIATGKSRRGVSRLIERFGWAQIFGTIQTADDAPSKPHPQMIRRAMAETGTEPQHTLMVGDSGYDMAMGARRRLADRGLLGLSAGRRTQGCRGRNDRRFLSRVEAHPRKPPGRALPAQGGSAISASMSDPPAHDWFSSSDEPDPIRAVQAAMRPSLPRKFYEAAGIEERDGAFHLTLDGRTAKTPARRPLAVPTRALGEALARDGKAKEM